jgi:hypothetical protein
LRYAYALAVIVGLFAYPVHAIITVNSTVSLAEGVRAQAVITNPSGFGESGDTLTAIAIKEINVSILLRDLGPTPDGGGALSVTKRPLTAFQAYGQGDPRGWPTPPITNPQGPWQGLMWPYRDQYDYFPDEFDPLGNDVGIPFFDEPDVYGFINIAGISRGGPTDPVGFPDGGGPGTPDWLNRGVTGNGLNGPASYFAFDLANAFDGSTHLVRLRIFAAQAIVVVQDQTGAYSEILVPIPDFEITFPEPGFATAGLAGAMSLLTRRRQSRN